jgi:predicted ArsR family transcriptional regulator
VSDVDRDAQIESVALLKDPLRRSIYTYVTRSDEPVGRDEVAAAVDASRSLVAFHLDKLVANGLLSTSFRRLSGRAGPGAGRPAKLYARSDEQVEVSLPAREYERAARLLLTAVEGATRGDPIDRLQEAAREAGAETGERQVETHGAPRGKAASLDRVECALEELGYEPIRTPTSVRMRNCPFHALSAQSPGVICGMNLALVEGLLDGLRAKGINAALAPVPGQCCVEIAGT